MMFEARYVRRLQIFAATVFALILMFGLYLTGVGIDPGINYYPKVGWSLVALGIVAMFVFVRRLTANQVILRIDRNGIDWARVSRPIPWDQLTAVQTVYVNRRPMLCLSLKNPKDYPLRSWFGRATAVGDRALGFGAMGLNVMNLDQSHEEMVKAVHHFRPDLF